MASGGDRSGDDDRDTATAETMISGVADPALDHTQAPDVATPTEQITIRLSARDLAQGATIGRYLVLERAGAGGMGVVYRAFDPELHREIALKLMRVGAVDATQGRSRLLREAQAMAKLAHPNVVPVYDAGTVRTTHGDEQVYIAMEYVEGETVAAWARRVPRSWREIVRVFLAAGRGLQAAHAKGLVHRDFKPENVLVAADGRARVLDFGLACRVPDAAGERVAETELDEELTHAGAILGTPRYMSPEQHAGKDTDARTDQFSFAVALAELLYGERPFAGASYEELKAEVLAGRVREPPATTKVPTFVRRAIERALAVDPEARFASMTELLAELGRDPDRVKKQVMLGGAVVGIAGAAVAITLALQPRASAPCEGQAARLAGSWDAARQQAVRAAFLATDRHYAEDTFQRVAAVLDGYAGAWVTARTQACTATRVRGEQSEALLDLRMRCLDRRRAELGALTELFAAAPDGEVVDRAVTAATHLAPLEACADVEMLEAVVPPPADPAIRARVEELREELARAEAMERAGKYPEGRRLAISLATEASKLAYAPFLAEALHQRGRLERATGDATVAHHTLEAAVMAAASARDDARAAAVWTDLITVLGVGRGRPDDALLLRPAAEAALRRSGNPRAAEAAFRTALGTVLYAAGEFPEAQAEHERALAIRERLYGPQHDAVAQSLNELGVVLKARGVLADARRAVERSLAIREHVLGPDHPELARSLGYLGVVFRLQGDLAEAERHHARALAILERAVGATHPDVATSLNNLGVVMREQRRYPESAAAHERALAIRERALGPEHPAVAMSLNNLGITAREQGRYDEARSYHERALALRERTLGADHPKVALTLNNLGETLSRAGRHEDARRHHERALEIQDRSLRRDHPERVYTLRGRAAALWALGRARDALADATRAVEIAEAQGVAAEELAETRFVLAVILEAGSDRGRARALVRAARAGYAAAGVLDSHPEVDTWLRTHAR